MAFEMMHNRRGFVCESVPKLLTETTASLPHHAAVDEGGYIFIVDRIKDVTLSSGCNVDPGVIEDALYPHPDVREAVVRIDDAYRRQAAKAFVVLRPGSAATPAQLTTPLYDFLSKTERSKAMGFRACLPETAVGERSREELIAEERNKHVHGKALA